MTKLCGDCVKAAIAANRSVYAWNVHSHHCFITSCAPKFSECRRLQRQCPAPLAPLSV